MPFVRLTCACFSFDRAFLTGCLLNPDCIFACAFKTPLVVSRACLPDIVMSSFDMVLFGTFLGPSCLLYSVDFIVCIGLSTHRLHDGVFIGSHSHVFDRRCFCRHLIGPVEPCYCASRMLHFKDLHAPSLAVRA